MEQLQRQQNDEQELERQNQFLTFKVDGECYGIGILEVKEILEHGRITPVPMMPEFIRGVINVRGRVVPVNRCSSIPREVISVVIMAQHY